MEGVLVRLMEGWYYGLRWFPAFLGIPMSLGLYRQSGRSAAAVSTILTLIWCLRTDDLTCVRFTPNLRGLCKSFFHEWLKDKAKHKKIRILDGFEQEVSRFLFVPNTEFWKIHKGPIRVHAILPDGSVETTSRLEKINDDDTVKGLLGFTRPEDLDPSAQMTPPYTFATDDGNAVVRLWAKNVNASFRNLPRR